MDTYGNEDQAPAPAGTNEQTPVPQQATQVERKLIKTGNIRYETDDLDQEKAKWLKAVERWKGYVSSETSEKYETELSVRLVLRVPAAYFDSLLVQGTAGVKVFNNRQINVSDVTEEYVDVVARLKTKNELEARYRELLKMAKSVTEVLEIERELSTVRADIESIQGRLNLLNSQVALSTLEVSFFETSAVTSSFGREFADAFVSGWDNLLGFIMGLMHLWPFLLVGGGVAMVIVKIRNRKPRA